MKTALETILQRNDCIFTFLGTRWSDREILEITNTKTHTGIVLIGENETGAGKFANNLLCQVTMIKHDPKLLRNAEAACKKPTKTDCLTVLFTDQDADHYGEEQELG